MEKQYKVLKSFSLKDLYLNNCPVEVFEDVFKRYGWDGWEFEENIFSNNGTTIDEYFPLTMQQGHQWFMDNGYIEEIIEDIELKPGMVLEDAEKRTIILGEKDCYCLSGFYNHNGIKYSPGWTKYQTLKDLNRHLYCKTWRIKQ